MFIQNNVHEGPGYLADIFKQDGLDGTIIGVGEDIPEKADGPVVILGGPQSANDDSPRLRSEERLIRYCFGKGIPVLGICLGSQLAAKALGGRVYRGATPEAGFYHDLIPDIRSSLFERFASPFTAFHWHQDTFDIPDGATRLVSSKSYRNQAFVYGTVVGLQFHIEIDSDTVKSWEKMMPPESVCGYPQRKALLGMIKANMDSFYAGFCRMYHIWEL